MWSRPRRSKRGETARDNSQLQSPTGRGVNRENTGRVRGAPLLYGDGMILAVCIFSQSATGEVSSAYFRKLAISRGGKCKFSQTGQTRAYARNTLTVQTCGPQALVKSPQSEREVASDAAATKFPM